MHLSSVTRWRRRIVVGLSVMLVLAVAGAVAAYVTPWPGAVAIQLWSKGDADAVSAALAETAPTGVESLTDQSYDDDDADAQFDAYFPQSAPAALPTVIWAHGGSWIAGDKSDYSGYYQSLADAGFTVISVNYSLSTNGEYPTVLEELDKAYGYVVQNASSLHVDPRAIFLGGDSAGAQISSQMAAMVTDPSYAAEVGIVPTLTPSQVRGVVLDCGVYDMNEFLSPDGTFGWTEDRQSIWAYTGSRHFDTSPAVRQMSTINHVTSEFPPAFITGGNVDVLTAGQSKPFADKLSELGVDVDSLFYPDDHDPPLDHEYQFDLETADGQNALKRTIEFLRTHSAVGNAGRSTSE
ncbi:acetyl esterase [Rhodococcus sp. 27YEA15]|uniref:alpha/beta hydrolase n=1 Tax=Rhodococcus sp. 27YEA15 TaxID=3156259 RepID=UPI003C7E2CC0